MSTSMRLGFVSLVTLAASGCSDDVDASTDASTTTAEPGTSSGDTSGLIDDPTGPVADDSSTGVPSSTEGSSTGALLACPELQEVAALVAETYRESQQLVGLAISVSVDGCQPWSQAWGVADVAGGEDLTPQHILRAGSLTKSYTAALMLRLEEEGLLTLDDTIDLWGIDVPSADAITVRQLLNHTSGLADYQNSPTFIDAITAEPARVWEPAELVDYTVELGPVGRPGGAHAYSNANYVIAALVGEEAAGGTYVGLLREHVLDPAGLEHTYLEGEETWDEPTAMGYLVQAMGSPTGTVGAYHASAVWSSGAVVGTGDDVRLWMETLLSTDFLTDESQAQLVDWVPGALNYGLGIFAVQGQGLTAYGHNGAVMGFQAAALHDPQGGATVSVLQNQIGVDGTGQLASDPTTLALQILEALAAS